MTNLNANIKDWRTRQCIISWNLSLRSVDCKEISKSQISEKFHWHRSVQKITQLPIRTSDEHSHLYRAMAWEARRWARHTTKWWARQDGVGHAKIYTTLSDQQKCGNYCKWVIAEVSLYVRSTEPDICLCPAHSIADSLMFETIVMNFSRVIVTAFRRDSWLKSGFSLPPPE